MKGRPSTKEGSVKFQFRMSTECQKGIDFLTKRFSLNKSEVFEKLVIDACKFVKKKDIKNGKV